MFNVKTLLPATGMLLFGAIVCLLTGITMLLLGSISLIWLVVWLVSAAITKSMKWFFTAVCEAVNDDWRK